jgi:hypothetical protein
MSPHSSRSCEPRLWPITANFGRAYPAWLIQAKDGTFWGSTGQYGNQSKGHFADGTVHNLNLGLPLR